MEHTDWRASLKLTSLHFISAFAQPSATHSNPAVHPHGQTFRTAITAGLAEDVGHLQLTSVEPHQVYPKGILWRIARKSIQLNSSMMAQAIGYINVPLLKSISVAFALIAEMRIWKAQAKKYKHNVVLLLNLTMPPAWAIVALCKIFDCKCIVYLCDFNVPGVTVANTPWNKCAFHINRIILKACDGRIVVSDMMGRDLLGDEHWVRVEGGISDTLAQETEKLLVEAAPNRSKTFKLIATGSLEVHNGFLDILKAFSMIEDPLCSLEIAGRGSLEREVVKHAQNDSRIVYHSYLKQGELLKLHSTGDLLINFRLTKGLKVYGFPSKTLEYFLSGVPVITTRVGAFIDNITEHCYIVDDESPRGLHSAIVAIMSSSQKQRKAKGLRARSYMLEHMSWRRQCEKFKKYIAQCLTSTT